MKILIYGAGAVGSVIGAFLARMGHDVSLLGDKEHLDAIQKNGLKITGIWGDYQLKAFRLYQDVTKVPRNEAFDLIFFTTDFFNTATAVEDIASFIKEGTLVSFQNGSGNIETILEKIKPDQFLPGRVTFEAEIIEPGKVVITVSAGDIVVGALPGAQPRRRPEEVARLLTLAKLSTRAVPDILTFKR